MLVVYMVKMMRLKVVEGDIGDDKALLNPNDLQAGIEPNKEIELLSKDRGWILMAKPDEKVEEEHILISKRNLGRLKVKEGDTVYITPKKKKGVGEEYIPPP